MATQESTQESTSERVDALGRGLRRNSLSFPGILAQSVANIAPTATPGIVIPLVFASAGNGTSFVYLIAMIGILLVSANINQFARRSATVGSLYAYTGQGLGPSWGILSGWSLAIAYLFTAASVLFGFVSYATTVLHVSGLAASLILTAVGVLAAGWFAYKDIQLSTILMLVLEFTSVALILVLAVLVLARHGFRVDPAQFTLKGVDANSLRLGLVLAVFSFVGFESATALGSEARTPLRSIPRSVLSSAAAVGLFFVVMSYVEVLGFRGAPTTLDKSATPLNDLAGFLHLGAFGLLLSIGAAISFFACALASLNAGARILFSLSRHGVIHPTVGAAHDRNATPHIAVGLSAALVFLVPAALLLIYTHQDPNLLLDAYGWLGTIATFGFLLAYLLISVAAPVFLRRRGEFSAGAVVTAVLAVVFLVIPVIGSVYPIPTDPIQKKLPYIFLGLIALGVAWLLALRARAPQVLIEIEHDLGERPLPEAA